MLNQDLKKDYFSNFLTDEDNNKFAIGDYKLESNVFNFINENNKKLFITNLIITIEDNSKFRSDTYGAMTKLNKGVEIYYINKDKNYIIKDNIKKNKDWTKYNCNIEKINFCNNDNFLRITFQFSKNDDCPIILKKGEKICIELNDDFTKLENQTFLINGFYAKV